MNTTFNPETITDVVWIQTGFIGDIVLTTGPIDTLRRLRPHIKQHVITTEIGTKILQNEDLQSLHVFKKREGLLKSFYSLKKSIKARNLKNPVILQPHRSFRSSILAWYLKIPVITYHETNAPWFARVKISRISLLHEASRIGLLLEPLGIPREEFIPCRPKLKSLPTDLIPSHPTNQWIGIAPGSVWGTKRWPIEKFTALSLKILEKTDYGVILIGSPQEAALAEKIETSSQNSRVINLCGRTKIQDLPDLFKKLTLAITNDSSTLHYASALNIPTLAIFGATIPAMGFGPLSTQNSVAEISLPCRPCSDHGPQSCPLGHFKCMNDLSVELVFQKLSSLLTRQEKID